MAEAPAEMPAASVRIDAGPLSCQVLAEVPSGCASLLRRGAVLSWCPALGEARRKFANARSPWHSQSPDEPSSRTPFIALAAQSKVLDTSAMPTIVTAISDTPDRLGRPILPDRMSFQRTHRLCGLRRPAPTSFGASNRDILWLTVQASCAQLPQVCLRSHRSKARRVGLARPLAIPAGKADRQNLRLDVQAKRQGHSS